jgi:anti-anti-sigma factor
MRFSNKPLEPFGRTILELSVPTDLSFKTPLVLRAVGKLIELGYLPGAASPRAELVIDEALTNAMVHGNQLDAGKSVRLVLFVDEDRWGAIVTDEGRGFTPADIPSPDDPETLLHESGKGIRLMDAYLDELIYNPAGNSVMLVRRREAEEAGAPSPAEEQPEEAPGEVSPADLDQRGPVMVVTINHRRLSDDNLAPIRAAFQHAAERAPAVVIDMGRVHYISSSIIGALMGLCRKIRQSGGRLVLTAIQDDVLEILKSVSLDRVLEIERDTDEVVNRLQGQRAD